jgi:glycosyltransferase involved in cell wall biosynthesis
MSRVLFVFPLGLHDAGHGNVRRMLEIARYLRDDAFAVDLIYAPEEAGEALPQDVAAVFRRVTAVEPGAASSTVQVHAHTLRAMYERHVPSPRLQPSAALAALVRAALEAEPYDAVVSVYAWTAPIYPCLARPVKTICDVQDILHRHAAACLDATGRATVFSLHPETERHLWRQWDALLAITPDDHDEIASAVRPRQHVLTVPHALPIADGPAPGEDDVVFYAGSDNDCNRESVTWFLDRVWPLVRQARPGAILRIAGLVCSLLDRRGPVAGVERLDLVPSIEPWLSAAGVVVAPYLYGSGLKIKVVEAAAAGKAIVTTPAGNAGSGLVAGADLIVESSPEATSSRLARLLGDRAARARLGGHALAGARARFSRDGAYGPLSTWIRTGCPSTEVVPEPAAEVPFAIPASAIERVRLAWSAAGAARLAAYGNGSHTRALLAALGALANGAVIVDRHATSLQSLANGATLVPAASFEPQPGDLVVLSSRTFEREMWNDLAPWREGLVHVVGLYDESLATPALRTALARRVTPRAPSESSRVDLKGARLVIVDPNVRSYHGHYLGYAGALAAAARAAGIGPVLLGHQQLESMSATSSVIATFSHDHWAEMVAPTGPADAPHVAAIASTFAGQLVSACRTLEIGRSDMLMLPTASLVETIGLTFVVRALGDAVPHIRILYRFGITDLEEICGIPRQTLATLLRYAVAAVRDAAGSARVSILTDSDGLSVEYADALGVAVTTVPIPVSPVLASGGQRRDDGPARLVYLGDARPEKGYARLADAADELERELADRHAALVVQGGLNSAADRAVLDARERLRGQTGVELIESPLDDDAYAALVTNARLILLPYEAGRYRTRTSGVLAEAVTAGVPVVVPDGTWLSSVLDSEHGAGVRFGGASGLSWREAVRLAWVQRDALADQAWTRRERFANWHSPASLLAHLLAASSVGADSPGEADARATEPSPVQ